MQKRHFEAAARQVKAIRDGEWTHESPAWSNWQWSHNGLSDTVADYSGGMNRIRAVQTAEAYILLFTQFNPLFDAQRFLIACGLVEKPTKQTRRRS